MITITQVVQLTGAAHESGLAFDFKADFYFKVKDGKRVRRFVVDAAGVRLFSMIEQVLIYN